MEDFDLIFLNTVRDLTLEDRRSYFDQLSSALAIRTHTVDDLGQVDPSNQVIVGQEGSDSHQVVIATRRIHLSTA